MIRVSFQLSLLLVLALAVTACNGNGGAVDDTEPMEAGAQVRAVDTAFEPAEITIPAGTTVFWTNEGNLSHTVTADDLDFDSGTLEPGDTFRFTFVTAGEYPYYCEFHGGRGGQGMAGTVIVE